MSTKRFLCGMGRRVAVCLGSALWCVVAHATCGPISCTATIQRLYVDGGQVAIWPTGGMTGITNCNPSSGVYILMAATDGNFSSKYAMLLGAFLAGQSVTLRTNDTVGASCTLAYAYVGS